MEVIDKFLNISSLAWIFLAVSPSSINLLRRLSFWEDQVCFGIFFTNCQLWLEMQEIISNSNRYRNICAKYLSKILEHWNQSSHHFSAKLSVAFIWQHKKFFLFWDVFSVKSPRKKVCKAWFVYRCTNSSFESSDMNYSDRKFHAHFGLSKSTILILFSVLQTVETTYGYTFTLDHLLWLFIFWKFIILWMSVHHILIYEYTEYVL